MARSKTIRKCTSRRIREKLSRSGVWLARIIEAAKRSKYGEMANQFQWEVTVIKDDKTMNAFALPG